MMCHSTNIILILYHFAWQTKAKQFALYASLLSAIIKQWLLTFHEPEKLYFFFFFSLIWLLLCPSLSSAFTSLMCFICPCLSPFVFVCVSSKWVSCVFFICFTHSVQEHCVCWPSIRSDFIISWRYTYWRNAINNPCYVDICCDS